MCFYALNRRAALSGASKIPHARFPYNTTAPLQTIAMRHTHNSHAILVLL
jgi:hypothetical protein